MGIRIAAVGDLHVTRTSGGKLHDSIAAVNEQADILLLCGDLTDYGMLEEAQVLAKELSSVKIPIIAVLGNHDFESDKNTEVAHILTEHGVKVLDGDSVEVHGVGFAGIKGFAGGFERGTLGFWGEPETKRFVQACLDEELKLESALARLKTERRVALLHYAPIRATVEGEPLEIYPYLGCGRLEEPLRRYPVDMVFHGHAHHGTLEGTTSSGTRVFNVALPLLRRSYPGTPPFRVLTLD